MLKGRWLLRNVLACTMAGTDRLAAAMPVSSWRRERWCFMVKAPGLVGSQAGASARRVRWCIRIMKSAPLAQTAAPMRAWLSR